MRGSFGRVLRVRAERPLDEQVALKICRLDAADDTEELPTDEEIEAVVSELAENRRLCDDDVNGNAIALAYEREVRAARSISTHANVTRVSAFFRRDGIGYLRMEAAYGDLVVLMAAHGSLPDSSILSVGKQIARGLVHIHDHCFVHRDVKPANMLIFPKGIVKLCDFGFAVTFDEARCLPPSGSPEYAAPEVFEPAERRGDPRAWDAWSLGISLSYMKTESYAFRVAHPKDCDYGHVQHMEAKYRRPMCLDFMMERARNAGRRVGVSDKLRNVVCSLTWTDPEKRAKLPEVGGLCEQKK